jgi:hypothetical protein
MAGSRVFFPARNDRYGTQPSLKFGTTVFLQDRRIISPFRTQELIDELYKRLLEERFDPDIDYVGLTGGHIMVSILLALVLSKYGRAKMLMWDASNSEYVARDVRQPVEAA